MTNPTQTAEAPEQTQQHAETLPTDITTTGQRWLPKRFVLLFLAAVVGGAVLLYGGRYYQYLMVHESTDNAFIEGHIIQISPKVAGHVLQVYVTDNQEVHQGDVLLDIDPRDYATRLAQAQAVLQEAENKQQAAQSNVALMQVTSAAGIQQARANVELTKQVVETAQAQVAVTRSRIEQARAQVEAAVASAAQARAQVTAAEAAAARAATDAQRLGELYRNDQIISRRDFDHATEEAHIVASQLEAARKRALATEAQVTEARAAQQTATEQWHSIESQVHEAQAHVQEALGRLASANAAPHQMAVSRAQEATISAEVAQARAAVERARLDLASTTLYAPESGRVTRRIVEAGAYVQVGQTLLSVVPHDVWVVANFMETQLAQMRPGQPVDIKVDAYPDQVFKGHIDSLQAGTGSRFSLLPPENATGNFVKVVQRIPVKIVFDTVPTSEYLLSPGMSVVPVVNIQ